jgi:hypothetical protein
VVLDNMIGYPDNIRLSASGDAFLVGITTPRFRKLLPPFLDAIAPYPALKRFLAKVGDSARFPVTVVTSIIGHATAVSA